MGAVEGWVVTHDGETIKTGFKDDFEAGAWLHRRQSQSIDWAVRHEGYDIVLVKDGKVVYSYKQAQKGGRMSGNHVLGLHTKEERRNAYTLAQRVYQKALRVGFLPEYNYALGYIEAIGDLVAAEASEDKELLKLLGDMQTELLNRGAIPV